MPITEQLREANAAQVAHGMIVGPAFATVRDLVLRHGRSFTRKRLPPGRWSREPQACYANALGAAMTRGLVYVEAFATAKPGALAVLHSWVTDAKDPTIAYDPTWKTGHEYVGIPFRLDYVLRMRAKAGHPGVLDIWELGWPLLRGDDRIDDVLWEPTQSHHYFRKH
jgi:hypothetical protein